jgi:hypothetical protein
MHSVPGYRSAKIVTVAVDDDGSSTKELSQIAIEKLMSRLGENVRILECNKLPSNYKANDPDIIE